MKIRVAAHTYTLEHATKEWFADTEKYGECDFDKCILKVVSPELVSRDRYLETLCHEIGHAINHEYSVGQLECQGELHKIEEHMNSLLSTGWFQVLRDNPQLLDLLDTRKEETSAHSS